MKIAVLGCCHGALDVAYAQLATMEQRQREQETHERIACLLVCGDFQAIRNKRDLQCMAVPAKYRALGGFYRYYTGERKAPILTIVIGGNHEASNYMWELYHGGWLAPNIYYLGAAGCVQVDGVRIAGLSGIYNAGHYNLGHFEAMPYDSNSLRSIYHIREYDVLKLMQLSPPNIILSHDWPQGIEQHGDLQSLLRHKPYFRTDISAGTLGSPPAMRLLRALRPVYWFSAHLHCRFEADIVHANESQYEGTVRESKGFAAKAESIQAAEVKQGNGSLKGGDNPDEIEITLFDGFSVSAEGAGKERQASGPDTPRASASANPNPSTTTRINSDGTSVAVYTNPDEIVLDDEIDSVELPKTRPSTQAYSATRFLALDKCLPRRHYLEIVEVPTAQPSSTASTSGTPRFTFDPEWIAITRAMHPYLSTERAQRLPSLKRVASLVQQELAWVREHVRGPYGDDLLDVTACQEFLPTAPGPSPENDGPEQYQQPPYYTNPQTEAFCSLLQIENRINPPPPEILGHFDRNVGQASIGS